MKRGAGVGVPASAVDFGEARGVGEACPELVGVGARVGVICGEAVRLGVGVGEACPELVGLGARVGVGVVEPPDDPAPDITPSKI